MPALPAPPLPAGVDPAPVDLDTAPTGIRTLPSMRSSSRYAALAQALLLDIQAGRYRVGDELPSEAVLQERFGVSRHTVRQALRELKVKGIVSSHPGVGTLVRSASEVPRFVHNSPSLDELLNFANATRMQVRASEEVVCDAALAAELECPVGQAWRKVELLRHVDGARLPIGHVTVYLRPEYAAIVGEIEPTGLPIFTLVERRYGVQLDEIRQQIASATLTPAVAQALQADDAHALQIVRRYLDTSQRVVEISIGIYPGSRFRFHSNIRIQRERPQGDA